MKKLEKFQKLLSSFTLHPRFQITTYTEANLSKVKSKNFEKTK